MATEKKEGSILTLLIVIGVVIFFVGAGLGILYQSGKDQKISAEIKTLSSDIVTTVTAYGKVTAINGRDLTISYNNQTLTINIPQNVDVTAFVPINGSIQGSPVAKTFSDIKKGDNLNIALKIGANGELTAQTVIIFSSGQSATLPQ